MIFIDHATHQTISTHRAQRSSAVRVVRTANDTAARDMNTKCLYVWPPGSGGGQAFVVAL